MRGLALGILLGSLGSIPTLAASVTAVPPVSSVGVTPGMGTTIPNQPLSGSTNYLGGGVSEASPAPTPPAVHETLPSTDGSTLYRAGVIPETNPGTPENQVKSPNFNVDPFDQGPDRSGFNAGTFSDAFRTSHP